MKATAKILRKVENYQLNETYNNLLAWFFSYPEREIGLTDLADATGVSKATANRVVSSLAQEGFLRIESIGRRWRISCNQEHPYN
ncbi:MAG: helix-turn-helix domain-containing protein, partial [Candidatus Aenigmatarchaeota archaeon]